MKRVRQSNMGCCAMLSDLCHVLSMHMLNCLPGCVQRDINILCPQQHGRGNSSVGKVLRHRCKRGLRHVGILQL